MTRYLLSFSHLFHVDALSTITMLLVAFVALVVGSFSRRYLKGDTLQRDFFIQLAAIVLSIFAMVCTDNIVILLCSWAVSNLLLTRLMRHKRTWEAARQSSILATKNFALGFLFLGLAMLVLYTGTNETSIQAILAKPLDSLWLVVACLLIALAAMTQSALWPFHCWLISSLNAPTPVSAIMHAGLVNGGGFLLARFAPMLVRQPSVLNIIFIAGIATALLGTLWKLMQSDVKRMLASSTMGQMGFMLAQCGLGLFPAAVAHLCWHGLFKAYLFLASGAAAKEKRLDLSYPPTLTQFFTALICGLFTGFVWSVCSGKKLAVTDTTSFLVLLAVIAGAQFALPIVRSQAKAKMLIALLASGIMGACYGFSVRLVEIWLEPLGMSVPQHLNVLHIIAAMALAGSWLAMLFVKKGSSMPQPRWLLRQYVRMLNASQPHPKTVTAHRNKYQF